MILPLCGRMEFGDDRGTKMEMKNKGGQNEEV
jgi:hypothetical protein